MSSDPSPVTDPALDAVLDRVDVLAGVPRTVVPLPGGLTNRNYRVTTRDVDVVVRVSPPTTGLLAVDREAEFRNSCIAARAGVGAPVVDYLPGRGVLVVGFIPDTRTYADADVAANLDRVAQAVRRLHEAEPFANRFSMFDIQARYLRIMWDNGFRMPEGYVDLLPEFERVRTALHAHPEPLVPCHNDLLAANFLDDGETVWIIDYEYSGSNEAMFELGNIAQEAGLDDDALASLVESYLRAPDPVATARAELWRVASAYGWTLWGTIQHGASEIDVDFWSWAMEKYDLARAALGSRRVERLLDLVGEGR